MPGVASLDIECQDWDKFVVGALRLPNGETCVSWDEDELFDAVAAFKGDVWTWAGGRYDSIWGAAVAHRRGIHAVGQMGGGGLVSLKVGRATIRDGYRLYPVSLKKAAPIAGLAKATTELPCRCGLGCGGFCSVRQKGMTARDRKKLVEYLVQDTRCCSGIVGAIHEFAAEHGIAIKNTVGGSAWATLQEMGAQKAEWPTWRDYTAARGGYYGGRTELFQTGRDADDPEDHRDPVNVLWRTDLNAAYPDGLQRTAVPVGDFARVVGHADTARAFERGLAGVYSACVTVPEMHVPPLPVRAGTRLLFCTGEVRGQWTGIELAAALEVGVRIDAFSEAITWEKTEKVGAPFVEKFWGLRKQLGKKSPQGAWLKWFCNSLTGKLAMKPEGERLEIDPDPDKVKACPADGLCFDRALCGRIGGKCCEHLCTQRCGKWLPMGRSGTIWRVPTHQLADCSHVQWAAYLTAATRVELGHQLRHCEEALLYCDTDSCYASRPITRRIGKELGQWNDEGIGLDWYARGPKAYRYAEQSAPLDESDEARLARHRATFAGLHRKARAALFGKPGELVLSGEYECRSKGVPGLDGMKFDRWARGEAQKLDAGVWGVKGGIGRGKIFSRRELSRAAKSNPRYAGSRVVDARGRTRPLGFKEYLALVDSGVL